MTQAARDVLIAFNALSPAERQKTAAEILRRSIADGETGKEVYLKRVGRSVVLIPTDVSPWDVLTASLDEFSEDFMADRNQPSNQEREAAFE